MLQIVQPGSATCVQTEEVWHCTIFQENGRYVADAACNGVPVSYLFTDRALGVGGHFVSSSCQHKEMGEVMLSCRHSAALLYANNVELPTPVPDILANRVTSSVVQTEVNECRNRTENHISSRRNGL
jgi:hypothetical protein